MKMILAFMILCFFPLSADAGGVWTHYLSANEVMDIASEGEYVWLATTGGVVKRNIHDGSYVRYTTADGLAGNYVNGLHIDRTGRKWFMTEAGLSSFDGHSWETYSSGYKASRYGLSLIVRDRDGIIWLGTPGEGVLRFDGGTWNSYTRESKSLPGNYIRAAAVDSENVKWFVSALNNDSTEELVSFDGKVWKTYGEDDGVPGCSSNIAIDRNGVKWFAYGSMLISFDGENFVQHQSNSGKFIRSIAIDKSDGKWLATYSGGVGRFKDDIWQWFPIADSTKFLNVHYCIAIDSDDHVWVNLSNAHSFAFGVGCFDGIGWNRYTVDDGPAANNIGVIGVDARNRKYFGTYFQGLCSFDGKTWDVPLPLEETGYTFSDIACDYDGVLWIAGGNLMSFNGMEKKNYKYPDGRTVKAGAVAVGPDNTKWFGISGGVASFNGKEWKYWTEANGLAGGDFSTIAVDRDNVVWVSSTDDNGSISSFDGKSWRSFSVQDGIPDLRVFSIAVYHDNVKWFGGFNGVFRFDGVSWENYSVQDGLVANWVESIAVDRNNVKWFATSNGISRFDGAKWESFHPDVLFPVSFNCVAVDKNNVKWFAGFNTGIYSYDDRASTPVQALVPVSYPLSNRPNPFNPSTTITFSLPAPGRATLGVYSITGQKVRELVSGHMPAGMHSVVWDGKDASGRPVSSGVYLSRLESGGRVSTGRMLMMK